MERLPLESKGIFVHAAASDDGKPIRPVQTGSWRFPPFSLPPLNMKWLVHATSILALDEKIGY